MVAVRFLDGLVVALGARGWHFVRLYRMKGFAVPLLWVYPCRVENLGVVVSARAVPGEGWVYYEARRGEREYLCPCGDAGEGAELVGRLLRDRILAVVTAEG
ncbi:hypothetical protein [Actinomadura terrae]|uniref:hypothetical protein n=1 Tax=Actinomadura terrae TaxID=604353 RepID=UPI001FA6BEE9|nr:hypothetical protein [Actinomadura terrae]